MSLPIDAAFLLVICLAACATDLRARVIPNWLTLPVLALAPLIHLVANGVSGLGGALLGCTVCAAVPLLLFHMGAMGGGDVKLFAALGALAGPTLGLELQLLAYNVLVVFALVMLARSGQLKAVLQRTSRMVSPRWLARSRRVEQPPELLATFRLGAPIFIATALVLASELSR